METENIKVIKDNNNSMDYYRNNFNKIEKLNQSQESLDEQLNILMRFANKLGLYDAADYINNNT